MEQIFDSGPGFWAVAPNVPKMAQNTKIVTYPTVFELGRSSLRIMLIYTRAKDSWNIFFFGPWFLGYDPKLAQNGPKHKNRYLSHSF